QMDREPLRERASRSRATDGEAVAAYVRVVLVRPQGRTAPGTSEKLQGISLVACAFSPSPASEGRPGVFDVVRGRALPDPKTDRVGGCGCEVVLLPPEELECADQPRGSFELL